MGSNTSTSAGREGEDDDMIHDTILDSDDSMDDNDSDGSGLESTTAENLISVFQVLVRNGRIHIMSSDESDNESASRPKLDYRVPKPPRIKYTADVEAVQKNDLNVVMQKQTGLNSNFKSGLPNLLFARELGLISPVAGFDKPHRNLINSGFLPNSVRKVANYNQKAFCGTYSKSGDIFLSAAQDRVIRIYDTSKNQFKEFKKVLCRDVGWSVLDTAFSPDGRHCIYSTWSEAIHFCNIYGDDQQEALNLNPDSRRFCIFSVVFSEDGNEILGGANDGCIYIYNIEANQRVLKVAAHDDDINSVCFADEESQILFSAADDGLCKVWDRRTLNESQPKPVGVFAGHIDGITFIDSKNDGRYLITNSKDQSIKLWDVRKFSSEESIACSKKAVSGQNWDYRWQRVPKKLCVPRNPLQGDNSVMTYRGHSVLNTLIRCRFSPAFSTGQRYIYTGCAAGRVVIYDVLTGKIEKILKGHKGAVRDVSWHPYSSDLVSTSWDSTLGLWTYVGKHALDSVEEGIIGIEPRLRRSSRISEQQATKSRVTSCLR